MERENPGFSFLLLLVHFCAIFDIFSDESIGSHVISNDIVLSLLGLTFFSDTRYGWHGHLFPPAVCAKRGHTIKGGPLLVCLQCHGFQGYPKYGHFGRDLSMND